MPREGMSSFSLTFLLHFTINHINPCLKCWGVSRYLSGFRKNIQFDVVCLFSHLSISCKWHTYSSFFTFVEKGWILKKRESDRLNPAESKLRSAIYSDTNRVIQVLYLLSILSLTSSGLCPAQNKHDPVWRAFRRWNALVALLKYSGGLELNHFLILIINKLALPSLKCHRLFQKDYVMKYRGYDEN